MLVDLLHEQLHPVRLTLLDLDDLVEVGFCVAPPGLDLTLDYLVVGRVDSRTGSGQTCQPRPRRSHSWNWAVSASSGMRAGKCDER